MTKTVEHMVKKQIYSGMMEKASRCLVAMGAEPGEREPNSWDGVMTMLADVIRHGKSADDTAAAILAAMKWMWAHLEHAAMCEIKGTEELIEAEKAAEKEESEKPEAVKPEAK